MFFITCLIVSWIAWFIFADKNRWRELFSVSIFGDLLGTFTDVIIEHYPYWEYTDDKTPPLLIDLCDEFGIYPVVIYLFIQWIPKDKSFFRIFSYWFAWTTLAIIIEYIHVETGHMVHSNGWTYWHSYTADWFLYWLFYQFHKTFQLYKLSK